MKRLATMGLLSAGALYFAAPSAQACGCFAPPDPTVPVVQAGERILFSLKDGQVTAHIQIQYAGDARDFGWLLPLPSVPVLELGTDELFTRLYAQTQPKYRLTRRYEGDCSFAPSQNVAFAASEDGARGAGGPPSSVDPDPSPLVVQDSIGPYDYAVLKADDKAAMFKWLTDNHYFIPTGTDETVGNYIRPGAYFLALKLQSGKSAGDLAPVVVRYPSDLPMIPIILTSVAALDNMGVQVWVLGNGRAIPRNFYHAVVNDALIDWNTAGLNYNDVVIKAAQGAPEKHAFVTEYAGPSTVMRNVLSRPSRFGTEAELAAQPSPIAFVEYLSRKQFGFSSQVTAILSRSLPMPKRFAVAGVTPAQFYASIRSYLESEEGRRGPSSWRVDYRPVELAHELFTSIAEPIQKASLLFDESPYLTRMYTTLSPRDMNKDPAFSFNSALPAVPNVHQATLTYHCANQGQTALTAPAELKTEQGWLVSYPQGLGQAPTVAPDTLPGALRYEVLPEEGLAQVARDNFVSIDQLVGDKRSSGCSAAPTIPALVALALLFVRRRRAS